MTGLGLICNRSEASAFANRAALATDWLRALIVHLLVLLVFEGIVLTLAGDLLSLFLSPYGGGHARLRHYFVNMRNRASPAFLL